MRLIVAKVAVDGKARMLVGNLDRLTRLEEFLGEDVDQNRTQVVFNWTAVDKDGQVLTRRESGGRAHADRED